MRVLLVSPSFFGYESAIAGALRAQGHVVDVIDERPSNRPLARAVVRIAPWALARRVGEHFAARSREISANEYDVVVVIKGEVVPEWFLRDLRAANPAARFVLYVYDSVSNSPQWLVKRDVFDEVFSFDRVDARRLPGITYKPLFYAPTFRPGDAPRDVDLSFVGTLHGDRHAFVNAVAAAVPPERRLIFFYSPARWFVWVRKALLPRFRSIRPSQIETEPLSQAEVADVMRRSKAVVDLQRPGQSGLTMRTFEVLASGAALITANPTIAEEDFYDPARILIVPAEPALIDRGTVAAFIARQPERASSPAGFEAHALATWAGELMAHAGERVD